MGLMRNVQRKWTQARLALGVWRFDWSEAAYDREALRNGKHLYPIAEFPGRVKGDAIQKRVAMVAIYPSEFSLFSLMHLLDALEANGFWALVVSTKTLTEAQRASILEKSGHLVERYPVGRDFGSFQMGLRWLESHGMLDHAELLAFTNDSLFYPSSFANQLKQMLSVDRPWYGLFENFEIHYHVQSFFQIFRRDLFTSPAFNKYWTKYKPLSSRTHSIHKGEVGFSKRLAKAGFQAYIEYSSARICTDVLGLLSDNVTDPSLLFALKHTLGHNEFMAVASSVRNTRVVTSKSDVALKCVDIDLVHMLAHRIENRNPTHSIGLLCNLLYEAPIKRDLVYRRTIELGTLLTQCRGFDESEKKLMNDDLRAKGLPSSLTHSRFLMELYGTGRI